jgi:hypothetical protein
VSSTDGIDSLEKKIAILYVVEMICKNMSGHEPTTQKFITCSLVKEILIKRSISCYIIYDFSHSCIL